MLTQRRKTALLLFQILCGAKLTMPKQVIYLIEILVSINYQMY